MERTGDVMRALSIRLLRRWLPLLALLVVVAAGMVSVDSFGVHAATGPWQQALHGSDTYGLFARPDGAVTAGNCSWTQDIQSYTAAGIVTGVAETNASIGPCVANAVIGRDNALYTVASSTQPNNLNGQVVAYSPEGIIRWISPVPHGGTVTLSQTLGSDGNVYGFSTSRDSVTAYLFGFAPVPAVGQTKPTVVLDKQFVFNHERVPTAITAYADGLVVQFGNNSFQYFGYDGTAADAVDTAGYINGVAVPNVAGTVFVPVKATSSNAVCPQQNLPLVSSLNALGPLGWLWPNSYQLPQCSTVAAMQPVPDGGLVALVVTNTGTTASYYSLLSLTANGTLRWQNKYQGSTNGIPSQPPTFQVQTDGSLIVASQYTGSDSNKGVAVTWLHGDTGVGEQVYDFKPTEQTGGYSFNTDTPFVTAPGIIYLALNGCGYSTNGGAVSCGRGAKLFGLSYGKAGFGYPGGVLWNYSQKRTITVGVWGDSFSSGEGVPPFEPGLCHRSSSAYARLLEKEIFSNFRFVIDHRFVACSGATTADVTGTSFQEELPQSISLSRFKDIDVTIGSIGGNDAQFAQLAAKCILDSCLDEANRFLARVNDVNTRDNIANALNYIESATNRAPIVLLGYPKLLPDNGCSLTAGFLSTMAQAMAKAAHGDGASIGLIKTLGRIAQLSDTRINQLIQKGKIEITPAETQAVNRGVTALNKVLAYVAKIQPAYFIDPTLATSPFQDHNLCSKNPFFNGVNTDHQSYSFHPNAFGQKAYEKLVLQQLLSMNL